MDMDIAKLQNCVCLWYRWTAKEVKNTHIRNIEDAYGDGAIPSKASSSTSTGKSLFDFDAKIDAKKFHEIIDRGPGVRGGWSEVDHCQKGGAAIQHVSKAQKIWRSSDSTYMDWSIVEVSQWRSGAKMLLLVIANLRCACGWDSGKERTAPRCLQTRAS